MGRVSSIYAWQATRRDTTFVIAQLRRHGYENVRLDSVGRIDVVEVRNAEYNPDWWKKAHEHKPFNPAGVPGL